MSWRTAAGTLALILVWELVTTLHLFDPLLVPAPLAVLGSLYQGIANGAFPRAIGWTLMRVFAGAALGGLAGVGIGAAIGWWPVLRSYAESLLDFFRSIPVMCVYPAFMVLLGMGDPPKIATITWTTALTLCVAAAYAVRQVPKTRLLAASIMGLRGFPLFWHIALPSALPAMLGGMRIALSLSLVVGVVTEMFTGTQQGIGKIIYDSALVYDTPSMYAAISLAGILGYTINRLVIALEHRVAHWAM